MLAQRGQALGAALLRAQVAGLQRERGARVRHRLGRPPQHGRARRTVAVQRGRCAGVAGRRREALRVRRGRLGEAPGLRPGSGAGYQGVRMGGSQAVPDLC